MTLVPSKPRRSPQSVGHSFPKDIIHNLSIKISQLYTIPHTSYQYIVALPTMDEPKYLEQLADKEVTGLSLRHEAIKRYLAELGTSPRSANGSSTSETLKSPCSRAASMDHGVCHVNRPGDSHSHPDGFSSVPQQRNDVDSQISLLQVCFCQNIRRAC